MKKGFVIFLTENFFPVVSNLIKSVLLFSVYNIEVNCINFSHDFQNERIISKTIYIETDCSYDKKFFNITKCKIISTLDSDFDIGLILDGDMIVTKEIDKIFEDNEERIQNYQFPLFAKHPHNPFDRWNHIVSLISKKQPKMKWVYSNYLFSKHHRWFFQNVLDIMNNISKTNHECLFPTVPEESILNALLAEYEVDYDLGYNYFPDGFSYVIDYYLDKTNKDGEKHIQEFYLDYSCPVKFYAFHGHDIKNVNFGKELIERLKTV